jgi:hypothetical protein
VCAAVSPKEMKAFITAAANCQRVPEGVTGDVLTWLSEFKKENIAMKILEKGIVFREKSQTQVLAKVHLEYYLE